jgi:hypothetical protein
LTAGDSSVHKRTTPGLAAGASSSLVSELPECRPASRDTGLDADGDVDFADLNVALANVDVDCLALSSGT